MIQSYTNIYDTSLQINPNSNVKISRLLQINYPLFFFFFFFYKIQTSDFKKKKELNNQVGWQDTSYTSP